MNRFLLILVIIIGIVPIAGLAYLHQTEQNQQVGYPPAASIDFTQPLVEKQMEPGTNFLVKSIRVQDGFVYHLLLENNIWIEAHLTCATKEEATSVAIELLKTTTRPVAVLRRKVGNYWIVDLQLSEQNNNYNLVDLLREQGLTF